MICNFTIKLLMFLMLKVVNIDTIWHVNTIKLNNKSGEM